MRTRTSLYVLLAFLTAFLLYAVYTIAWFAWLTATPTQYADLDRTFAMRWEIVAVLTGIAWLSLCIYLCRSYKARK
jgi:hypothetical protein